MRELPLFLPIERVFMVVMLGNEAEWRVAIRLQGQRDRIVIQVKDPGCTLLSSGLRTQPPQLYYWVISLPSFDSGIQLQSQLDVL